MVERSVPDGGGRNVVNVILVDFRGLDTLGEITVLAAAAIGSVALARAGAAGRPDRRGRRTGGGRPDAAPSGGRGGVRRIVVVDVAVRLVFLAVMVGSIYLLFAGHNQPGGGFVGGLVAGAAIALRYVAGGIDEVRPPVAGPPVDGARHRAAARRRSPSLVPAAARRRRRSRARRGRPTSRCSAT